MNALVVLAAPTQDGSLHLDAIDRLPFVDALNAIKSSVGEEAFDFHRLQPPTYDSLERALRTNAYNVLYFIGHGALDLEDGRGYLLLEDGTPGRKGTRLSSDNLRALLNQSSIQIVVLSGCDTARSEPRRFLAGMVQAAADCHTIEVVVGMQLEVCAHSAEAFDLAFFSDLACLEGIGYAVMSGRKAIVSSLVANHEDPQSVADWAIPVMFSRAAFHEGIYEDTVRVEPGSYRIGFSDLDLHSLKEMRLPQVLLEAFQDSRFRSRTKPLETPLRIGRWPVTNYQYKRFVDNTNHALPEGWRRRNGGEFPPGKATHPVVGVSLEDAAAFCQWSSRRLSRKVRLPSADEWEIAAQGASRSLYSTGRFDNSKYALGRSHSEGTCSVFRYPLNRSNCGIWDAIGNVWEWTTDTERNGMRAVVGGCWHSDWIKGLPSLRSLRTSSVGHPDVGFRYVVE